MINYKKYIISNSTFSYFATNASDMISKNELTICPVLWSNGKTYEELSLLKEKLDNHIRNMKVLKNNSFFITLSFINKKLYKRIFFSLFVMTAAAFTELITLYIAYPVFALLSGEQRILKI